MAAAEQSKACGLDSRQSLFNAIKSNNAALVEKLLLKESSKLLLSVDEKNATVLHQAAVAKKPHILPLVVVALERSGIIADCLRQVDWHGNIPLVWATGSAAYFENFTALIKSCDKYCPEILLKSNDAGENLFHCAVRNKASSALKVLVARDDLKEELLAKNQRGLTPFQTAQELLMMCKTRLDMQKSSFEHTAKHLKWDEFTKTNMARSRFQSFETDIKLASDIVAVLDYPTAESKAAVAAKEAVRAQALKIEAQKQELKTKCQEFLKQEKFQDSLAMIASKDSLEQEVALKVVASYFQNLLGLDDEKIPLLSSELISVFEMMIYDRKGTALLDPLSVLSCVCQKTKNLLQITANEKLMKQLGQGLRTRINDVQLHCLCIMKLSIKTEALAKDSLIVESWIQPLLLLKLHALVPHVQKQAASVLDDLQADNRLDPSCWTVDDVLLWMDSKEDLQEREAYAEHFVESGIDGLHLLDLTHEDMKGLGVRHLSERRKLTAHVDELRRLNAPSYRGPKDVFLSYSHINFNFALQLKTALQNANYSVWIDKAGIRAGVKWREAIASGIESCKAFIYVMSARSVSSEYCLDEIALAEDVKKPIFSVASEKVAFSTIDPGLKLTISRRQWTDFSDGKSFDDCFQVLLDGLKSAIGEGTLSNSDSEIEEPSPSSPAPAASVDVVDSGGHEKATDESSTNENLLKKVTDLESRVAHLEETVRKLLSLDTATEQLQNEL
ncbi:uncharacterized protein [Oscarella lobularis]|uniref:uncharacterized protein n=1 Tax=Oscarella lobularis TaxID=121494 RepID=UPI003313C16A